MSPTVPFNITCNLRAQQCVPLLLRLVMLAGVCALPSSLWLLSAPPALAATVNQRSAAAHFKRGLEFGLQENWKAAEAAYREAIRLDPNNPQYRSYLSSALAAQGKFAPAKQSSQQEKQLKNKGYKPVPFERTRARPATKTAAKSPPRIASKPATSRLPQKSGQSFPRTRPGPGRDSGTTITRGSEDGLTVTIPGSPDDPFRGTTLPDITSGSSSGSSAGTSGATGSGANGSTAFSASDEAALGNAILLYENQKWPQAEAEYRRVLRAHPQMDEVWNGLGDTCSKQNKWGEAEKAYREAVRLKPQEGFYHAQLAQALLKQGKREEAVKEAQVAVDRGLEDHEVFDELGLTVTRATR